MKLHPTKIVHPNPQGPEPGIPSQEVVTGILNRESEFVLACEADRVDNVLRARHVDSVDGVVAHLAVSAGGRAGPLCGFSGARPHGHHYAGGVTRMEGGVVPVGADVFARFRIEGMGG